MDVQATAAAIQGTLGSRAQTTLDEAGWVAWEVPLARCPAAIAHAHRSRLPGLAALIALREAHAAAGDLRPAVAITRAMVGVLSQRLGESHPEVLGELAMLGALAFRAGRFGPARQLLTEAFDGLIAAGARAKVPGVGQRLAEVLLQEGAVEEAFTVAETAWTWLVREGPDPQLSGVALVRAEIALRRGDLETAIASLHEAWVAGPPPAQRAKVGLAYGRALALAELPALAAEPLRAALALEGEPGVDAAFLLIACLEAEGTVDEALRTLEAALVRARHSGAVGQLAARLAIAARVMGARGRLRDAENLLLEALDVERRVHPDDSVEVASRLAAIGRLCLRQGRTAEALGWLEPAVSTLRRRLPVTDERARSAVEDLAAAMIAEGRARLRDEPEIAAAMGAEVHSLAPWLVSNHPLIADARRLMGR